MINVKCLFITVPSTLCSINGSSLFCMLLNQQKGKQSHLQTYYCPKQSLYCLNVDERKLPCLHGGQHLSLLYNKYLSNLYKNVCQQGKNYNCDYKLSFSICIAIILLLRLIEKLADQKGNKNKPMSPTISRLEKL